MDAKRVKGRARALTYQTRRSLVMHYRPGPGLVWLHPLIGHDSVCLRSSRHLLPAHQSPPRQLLPYQVINF